jgi:hypothetical protein
MRAHVAFVVLGLAVGCSDLQPSPLPALDAPAGDVDASSGPLRCGADAGVALDGGDPTVVVTDWAQVQRYNCARDDGGQIVACKTDDACPLGRVCDTSASCGCCVALPPAVDTTQALRRALYTSCADGHCTAPNYCTAAADGRTCAMTFSGQIAVWAMRHQSPANACPLDDLRRQLCIKAEPTQACLWILDIPGSSYRADAPFPTDYTDVYECGGRTCNGAETFRVHPNAGVTFTATLIVDNC